jgi:long-chain acyl-CoA synthetase
MLSHKNIASMIGVLEDKRDDIPFCKDDVHLSYLPLPHLFERAVYISLFYNGGKLYFLSGDIT